MLASQSYVSPDTLMTLGYPVLYSYSDTLGPAYGDCNCLVHVYFFTTCALVSPFDMHTLTLRITNIVVVP